MLYRGRGGAGTLPLTLPVSSLTVPFMSQQHKRVVAACPLKTSHLTFHTTPHTHHTYTILHQNLHNMDMASQPALESPFGEGARNVLRSGQSHTQSQI